MFDWRVDAVGFVKDLVKKVVDEFSPKIKERMLRERAEAAEGKVFKAKLIPCSVRTVDADKFLRMYDRGAVKRGDFLDCIRVSSEPTAKLLSAADLEKISDVAPGTPRLVIDRIEKGEPDAQAALANLSASLAAPVAAAA
jgi:hypothetical protein